MRIGTCAPAYMRQHMRIYADKLIDIIFKIAYKNGNMKKEKSSTCSIQKFFKLKDMLSSLLIILRLSGSAYLKDDRKR